MPHTIMRTVTVSACNGQHVDDHGEFADFSDVIIGHTTPEKATRYFRKKLGDSTITINNVESETRQYTMSLLDFIIHATQKE